MALRTVCPKCDNSTFEMAETEVYDSNYRLMFVRCRKCGAAVGFTEYYNINVRLEKLANKLGVRLD